MQAVSCRSQILQTPHYNEPCHKKQQRKSYTTTHLVRIKLPVVRTNYVDYTNTSQHQNFHCTSQGGAAALFTAHSANSNLISTIILHDRCVGGINNGPNMTEHMLGPYGGQWICVCMQNCVKESNTQTDCKSFTVPLVFLTRPLCQSLCHLWRPHQEWKEKGYELSALLSCVRLLEQQGMTCHKREYTAPSLIGVGPRAPSVQLQ